MSDYSAGASTSGKLVTWFFVALLALAALKLVLWMLGVVVGIGSWLLFSVAPILLLGWLTLKLFRWLGGSGRTRL